MERPSGRALKPYVGISKIHILFKISSSASCSQAAYFWVIVLLLNLSTTISIEEQKYISKKEKKHQLKSKF